MGYGVGVFNKSKVKKMIEKNSQLGLQYSIIKNSTKTEDELLDIVYKVGIVGGTDEVKKEYDAC